MERVSGVVFASQKMRGRKTAEYEGQLWATEEDLCKLEARDVSPEAGLFTSLIDYLVSFNTLTKGRSPGGGEGLVTECWQRAISSVGTSM